jgi:hypothetical protein
LTTQELEIVQRHLNAMLSELMIHGAEAQAEDIVPLNETVPGATSDDQSARDHDLMQAAQSEWRLLETREGESYSWPQGPDDYSEFRVYEPTNARLGRFAIGKIEMGAHEYWGRRRPYFVVFRLGSGGGSKQPLAVFVAADDHQETDEYVAVIRGSGGDRGQRMFDPEENLPPAYGNVSTVTFRDRIAGTPRFRGYRKLGVLAHADDARSMLRHAAIQAELRH